MVTNPNLDLNHNHAKLFLIGKPIISKVIILTNCLFGALSYAQYTPISEPSYEVDLVEKRKSFLDDLMMDLSIRSRGDVRSFNKPRAQYSFRWKTQFKDLISIANSKIDFHLGFSTGKFSGVNWNTYNQDTFRNTTINLRQVYFKTNRCVLGIIPPSNFKELDRVQLNSWANITGMTCNIPLKIKETEIEYVITAGWLGDRSQETAFEQAHFSTQEAPNYIDIVIRPIADRNLVVGTEVHRVPKTSTANQNAARNEVYFKAGTFKQVGEEKALIQEISIQAIAQINDDLSSYNFPEVHFDIGLESKFQLNRRLALKYEIHAGYSPRNPNLRRHDHITMFFDYSRRGPQGSAQVALQMDRDI